MSYYFNKTIKSTFPDAILKATEALKNEGFGVLTEIDVKATLKKKIDVDFRNYHILGACSPQHAFKALSKEDKIGTMLPCSVIVQQVDEEHCEISAIDPVASMMAVGNENLGELAIEIQSKLKRVVESLS